LPTGAKLCRTPIGTFDLNQIFIRLVWAGSAADWPAKKPRAAPRMDLRCDADFVKGNFVCGGRSEPLSGAAASPPVRRGKVEAFCPAAVAI
jgi:hypothetical protein